MRIEGDGDSGLNLPMDIFLRKPQLFFCSLEPFNAVVPIFSCIKSGSTSDGGREGRAGDDPVEDAILLA